MRSTSRSGRISGIFPLPEERRRELGRPSRLKWSLPLAALALCAVGLATIHSASAEMVGGLGRRQALWVAVGIVAAAVAFAVDYRRLARWAWVLWGFSVVSLALVLTVGMVRGGARSWLGWGAFHFQPAEVAKLTTAVLLAALLARVEQRWVRWGDLLLAGTVVAVPMLLLVLQPDLGGAAMFLPMLLATLLVAGVRLRVLVAAACLALAVGGVAWTFGMQDYQRQRIATFLTPGSDPQGAGYQVRQSKIAVGSGGLTGNGYLRGTQSHLRFLPARHTDFVFAVLAEEWGFLGVAVVLGLYALFLSSAAEVALRARDRLGVLLVVALLATLAFHVLYNTAMVVGLVPITGIPLPFLSFGGSFTLFCLVATGLVLGIDARRYVNR